MMNKAVKIILLAAAVLIAVALVMSFYSTIVSPPKKTLFKNQYFAEIHSDVESIVNKKEDPELYLMYASTLHKLNFMLEESKLSNEEYDELKKSFVETYVPQYVTVCQQKFSCSVWNESVLKQMQKQIREIKNLRTSDNSVIVEGDISKSLSDVDSIINRYYVAKLAASASGFKGLDSAKERIKKARYYASSSPLNNCSDLVGKLNNVADRLNSAHVKHLATLVDELSDYYYYYPKSQFDEKKIDVYKEIDLYKKSARSVYGFVHDIKGIENNYTDYCQSANVYYRDNY